MRLHGRRRLVVALGAVAFVSGAAGFVVTHDTGSGHRPLEVRAAGDVQPGDRSDPLPDVVSSSTTTGPGPSSSSSSSTTSHVKIPKSSAPTTTTTVPAVDCAPANPGYAFGLLRQKDGNGWSVGGNPALQRTVDGGATWTPACIRPAAVSQPGGAFRGIAFAADGTHGWVVGGTPTDATALRTVDGGQHWLIGTLPAGTPGTLNGVAFADLLHGWAVGHLTGTGPANAAGGLVLATSDGGATWAAQALPVDVGRLTRIAVADTAHAWAVGVALNGTPLLVATSDGGATWARQTLPEGVTRELRDVAFADRQHGWAVGASTTAPPPDDISGIGVVLVTSDGGATWTHQATTPGSLWSLDIVDRDTVFAGGGYSLFSTGDGGATWDKQTFTLPALDAISFTDAGHGWVTHSMYSVICRTDDGGRTWVPSGVRPGMTLRPCT